MDVVKLSCPSCGASLELPGNLSVAHCLYCGAKILLDKDGLARETRELERYVELSKVAKNAKNYNELLQYCNRILELDPENVEAWINKGIATFWLGTQGEDSHYSEAMEYLNKAAQIAPTDTRVPTIREELTKVQVATYTAVADATFIDLSTRYGYASEYASLYATVMQYYLLVLECTPNDETLLEKIEDCDQHVHRSSWDAVLASKLNASPAVQAKRNADRELVVVQRELYSHSKNIFNAGRMKELEKRQAELMKRVRAVLFR